MKQINMCVRWLTFACISVCNVAFCVYVPSVYILFGMVKDNKMPVIVLLAVVCCLVCWCAICQLAITINFFIDEDVIYERIIQAS